MGGMELAPCAADGSETIRLPSGDQPPAPSLDIPMTNRRSGFTMIELVIAITIGIVLTGIAYRGFAGYMGRTAARSARTTFASLHARTRANAIEMGTTV